MISKALFALLATFTSLMGTPRILEEKIGQMIIVALVVNPAHNTNFMAVSPYHLDPAYAKKMIQDHQIGGLLCLGTSTPQEHVTLIHECQALSKEPLFIFQDAEWGLSMRMTDGVMVYPKAMTLGALVAEDDHLIYQCGLQIGKQLRALGIHSSLSPVCDVNNNAQNPIINTRSFGQDPQLVAKKATLMMQGLRDGGTLPCAKHFPGHGNTSTDSHHTLPYIAATQDELTAIELVPFAALIKAGISALMIAHLDVPSLTNQPGMPTSLSKSVIQRIRHNMQFQGLIMPDGLGMGGLTESIDQDTIIINAVLAGNDLLLCPIEVPRAIASIKDAVMRGIITEQTIDEHVARIMHAKKMLAIERSITYNESQLISTEAVALKQQLYTAAITLARNEDNRLPLTTQIPIDVVIIGQSQHFHTTLEQYVPITIYRLPLDATQQMCDHLFAQLHDRSSIIISLHLPSRSGMIEMHKEALVTTTPPYVSFIKKFGKKASLVLFGNPYNVAHIDTTGATIIAYENEPEAQHAAALTIIGKHNPRGQLPVTAGIGYPAGFSVAFMP